MRGMPYTGKMLRATVVREFFFRVFPVPPTGKVFAGLNVNMTPDTCGQLMNHLRHFYRLKDGEGIGAIYTAHGNFHRSTEASTNSK